MPKTNPVMSPRVKLIAIAAAVLAVALIAMIVYLVITVDAVLRPSAPPPSAGAITGNVSVSTDELLTYNDSQSLVEYLLLDYRLANATEVNASLYVYARQPTQRIYLVDTLVGSVDYCIRCFQPVTLYDSLQQALKQRGLILNATSLTLVDLDNISTIPDNSTVVLASGLIPASMLPDPSFAGSSVSGNESLLGLLSKGDYVIYTGIDFNTSLGIGDDIFVTPQDSLDALTNSSILPMQFNGTRNATQSDIDFNDPTFKFFGGSTFHNVTAVDALNGTLIALSNYPSLAYANTTAFAEGLATVIDSRFWIKRLAYGSAAAYPSNSIAYATMPVLTTQQVMAYPGNASDAEANPSSAANTLGRVYSLLMVNVTNPSHLLVTQIQFVPTFLDNGIVTMPSVFGETQALPLTVTSANELSVPTAFHISIVNLSGDIVDSLPIGFYNASFSIVHYYSFSIPSGYYMAELQDTDSREYTSSLFYIANVTFTPTVLSFKNSTFAFNISSNRLPLYNASYTVALDGEYNQSGIATNSSIAYSLPQGTVEQYGSKTFEFSMFGSTYDYNAAYNAPVAVHIPALYIEFGLAAAVIILLNVVLKAPTQDDYFIDVPNFPPVKRVKLKSDRSSLLSVFDTVNYSYHWKYMPLTADEVKNGVSTTIRYENVPIAVTLQNTTAVLNKLVNAGALAESGGHYAPLGWVKASGHSVEYLTVFRRLRDYCVSNAMLFTDLDAAEHADMIITKRGSQAHIVIYSDAATTKPLALNNAYRIYLVFLSEVQRLDFIGALYNSYGEEAELLRMGIEYSYIVPIDTENLDQLAV